jgi:hypothetical protein
MKILKLPHRTVDYLCPINGLCDIYEWKTGTRIPDELAFYVRTGFMLISQKRANPPKMIFMSITNIGKQLFEFWRSHMGYNIIAAEGKTFRNTLIDIQSLIDMKIPVILFGLDMYHLPYQEKFYHRQHIPGHVVLMTGYDDQAVYIHDNSKTGVQPIPNEDLQLAWQNDYLNISKKNAYFGIDFDDQERDAKSILKNAYSNTARCFLNPTIGISGIKGMDRFIREFSDWRHSYDTETLKKIYTHFVMFTGSVLPGLPAKLDQDNPGIENPHQGLRDKLAASLIRYHGQFGNGSWVSAAEHLSV